ncbi:hypothetical protein ACLK1S_04650 [Escherichia coli]
MGCSNPHPHGQTWADRCLPNEADAKPPCKKNILPNRNHQCW